MELGILFKERNRKKASEDGSTTASANVPTRFRKIAGSTSYPLPCHVTGRASLDRVLLDIARLRNSY